MADGPMPRICWDACCFIKLFNPHEEDADICAGVFQDAEDGKLQLVTSTIALNEVGVPGKRGGGRTPREPSKELLERACVNMIAADHAICEKAREFQWELRLKQRDAIYVATAVIHGCQALETYDDDLLALANRENDLGILIRKVLGAGDNPIPFTGPGPGLNG